MSNFNFDSNQIGNLAAGDNSTIEVHSVQKPKKRRVAMVIGVLASIATILSCILTIRGVV